ncbi:MAG: lipid-A-disaccharide synthase [Candidatus Omnitrophota bacterium]|nr:lipid-A-disaccharide synthase [Candidatus Omnitrophota bacterium]
MTWKNILIVSGEPSGDLHAANLVNDLKGLNPGLRFFGIGGNRLKKAGVDIVFDISGLALVGAVEVLKNIFTVGRAYGAVISKIDAEKPDLAILVDYPGFNLRLAKALKKRSIPVVYYISPQVWAWGHDRVNIIKRCVAKILVFFKFEEELYKRYDVDAEFVGHPLLDTVRTALPKQEFLKKYGLAENKKTLALLPGSRRIEVKSLLRIMISAARLVEEALQDVQFVVSKHPDLPMSIYEDAVRDSGPAIKFIEADMYDMVASSDFAIVASGTATLETAIIGTPLVIIYKASLITYCLYRLVAKIAFLGLVNIIAGKEIAPEFLQYDATPEKIAAKVTELLSDGNKLAGIREELARVKASLGPTGASMRAAHFILSLGNHYD